MQFERRKKMTNIVIMGDRKRHRPLMTGNVIDVESLEQIGV
jgi:hypothetical protein